MVVKTELSSMDLRYSEILSSFLHLACPRTRAIPFSKYLEMDTLENLKTHTVHLCSCLSISKIEFRAVQYLRDQLIL